MKQQNMQHEAKHADRQQYCLDRNYIVELNEHRRRYIHSFFHSLGYDTTSLSDNVLGPVFSLLTRIEEYKTRIRHNDHNWEIDYAPLERVREATKPVIEHLLCEWMRQGAAKPLQKKPVVWPEGKRFALCLTHDMDILSGDVFLSRWRSLPAFFRAPFRERIIAIASMLKALGNKCLVGKRIPDPLLSEWMNVEEQYGFRSSFFFLPQPLPEPVWQDSFYCYNDRVTFDKTRLTIAEIMKKMIDRGWDVGLHGSSMSHASPDLLERERLIVSEACGQEIETVRQHHLFYDIRFTPLYQHRAGFKADSSLGSNVRSCFRCGTGMPFYLYDFIADKELELLEVPLVIQDIALFRNLQMDFETAVNHCFEVMQEVAEIGGAMTLLWHNNYYASSAEYSAYQAILKKASQLGAWGCSVRQMYHWWKNRRSTN